MATQPWACHRAIANPSFIALSRHRARNKTLVHDVLMSQWLPMTNGYACCFTKLTSFNLLLKQEQQQQQPKCWSQFLKSSTASLCDMGSGASDFDPVGSPETAKANRAQRASFLQDALQECRRMVAAMHTIWDSSGKSGVLRPALAWGCFACRR
jgi:hypothetical protein